MCKPVHIIEIVVGCLLESWQRYRFRTHTARYAGYERNNILLQIQIMISDWQIQNIVATSGQQASKSLYGGGAVVAWWWLGGGLVMADLEHVAI